MLEQERFSESWARGRSAARSLGVGIVSLPTRARLEDIPSPTPAKRLGSNETTNTTPLYLFILTSRAVRLLGVSGVTPATSPTPTRRSGGVSVGRVWLRGDRRALRLRACRIRESAYVSIRQHTAAYFSIRQHTSAYLSILRSRRACLWSAQHCRRYSSRGARGGSLLRALGAP